MGGPFLAPAGAGILWYVVMWGIGGVLGCELGILLDARNRGWPHPWRWLVDHREVGLRFLGENTTAQALGQVLLFSVGFVGSVSALGAVRGGQLFFSPFQTLHAGIYLAVVPEGTLLRNEPARLRRRLTLVSLGMASLAIAWTGIGLVLPDAIGRGLFGSTWSKASDLILPLGIAMVANTVTGGALLGLRSLADARRSLRARLAVTPWLAICPIVGVWLGDAMGFVVGSAIGAVVATAIWWRAFGASLHAVHTRLAAESTDQGDQGAATSLPEVLPGHVA
jgi:hypothetical protein